jgi:hypothetical protein
MDLKSASFATVRLSRDYFLQHHCLSSPPNRCPQGVSLERKEDRCGEKSLQSGISYFLNHQLHVEVTGGGY